MLRIQGLKSRGQERSDISQQKDASYKIIFCCSIAVQQIDCILGVLHGTPMVRCSYDFCGFFLFFLL